VTTFQIVTLPVLAVMILVTAVAIGRRRLAPRFGAAWIALWVAAAVGILDPDILARIATFLGIGRGVDLVLYVSLLVFFIAFFLVYLRFRRLDEQLTQIIRHLAIRDAERDEE
jgi:small membrane protein